KCMHFFDQVSTERLISWNQRCGNELLFHQKRSAFSCPLIDGESFAVFEQCCAAGLMNAADVATDTKQCIRLFNFRSMPTLTGKQGKLKTLVFMQTFSFNFQR